MRFHTSLPVENIEDTVAFYRVLFDAPPAKTQSGYVKFLPPGAGLNISFHENPGAVRQLLPLHLGLEMADQQQLNTAHERLAQAGLTTLERETAVCCFARQDKFWVTDPNGYQWEIYLLLADTEQRSDQLTRCCAT